MEIKIFKAAWGMEGDWDTKLKRIAEAGYDGVETPMPAKEEEHRFRELLDQYGLELILHIYTGKEDNEKPYPDSAEAHIASLETQLERAASFRPLMINSHSAKDSMPYEEQLNFFSHAVRLERQAGIPLAHETHRGRATCTPWATARLLRDLPELHITADFSHWCNVCESMLHDQEDNLSLAMRHSIHIHARVGYEQGPQVPDFRAPEYEYALLRHEQWWDEICGIHQAAGRPFVTCTPEFGPPGYMHTHPFTRQPVVDLWEICLAMARRFRDRYRKQFS
ncbi:sugar phosphate isomerase/epimerase family protein [Paenibacillus alkalitolerans]|uniref:sugar phosphate isomerase/epimerase family protein n=1 Tax=Paenibacillus alkalitolerans TaxID=2799335 RepID=UPI0018F28230|nr:TIM barrel protein [Paenibacillus alkalitolerans]